MLRRSAFAAALVLAVPTLVLAQGGPPEGHGHGGRPVPGHPGGPPHGPPGGMAHGRGQIHPGPGGQIHPGPGGQVRPGPGGQIRPGPGGQIHPGPGGGIRPGPGGHPAFVFRGHQFHRVPFAHPWVYPPGYGYRRWGVGAVLPPLFWSTPRYYYTGWAALGLPPPPPGTQWVQYGPDLLLVSVTTGRVIDVAYGVFY